jgi:hypothetical protein
MRYKNIVIALGILIVIMQFLGFPSSWNNAFYALLGLSVIALAYAGGKSAGPTVNG